MLGKDEPERAQPADVLPGPRLAKEARACRARRASTSADSDTFPRATALRVRSHSGGCAWAAAALVHARRAEADRHREEQRQQEPRLLRPSAGGLSMVVMHRHAASHQQMVAACDAAAAAAGRAWCGAQERTAM